MSAEADQALVRRMFDEIWNTNNLQVAKEIIHKDYSSIENQAFTSDPGPEIVAADVRLYQSLYEKLEFEIERMFTQDGLIVTIWQASGESKLESFVDRAGDQTPKSLQAEGASLTEVRDGKISAHRFLWPRSPLVP